DFYCMIWHINGYVLF
nr:immunoglobulin light chain junction region [Macaca mulatta]MOW31039.1 immunoglobulin light chain junction region [Macaca mulatta]MOW31051.1 immunoglobulin light chain junction region [Macaca mulatta]MOW31098.1 immunoglobulin light chain junction region [Macaca mulatta]MOW31217.1 immunoglobulin light chain junction region [Macaca mulatta]